MSETARAQAAATPEITIQKQNDTFEKCQNQPEPRQPQPLRLAYKNKMLHLITFG